LGNRSQAREEQCIIADAVMSSLRTIGSTIRISPGWAEIVGINADADEQDNLAPFLS